MVKVKAVDAMAQMEWGWVGVIGWDGEPLYRFVRVA